MSLWDYQLSGHIDAQDYPFRAIVMAAMRKADTENLRKLREAFPHVHRELTQRWNAPAGRLENDPPVRP